MPFATRNFVRSGKVFLVCGLLLLLIALAVHLFFAFNFNFTQDDAFITFRYAENFRQSGQLVYNLGERVEGYTNFFWLLAMIVGRMAGFDYIVFSRVLGLAFSLASIITAYLLALSVVQSKTSGWQHLLAGFAALLVGTAMSFAYWAVSGLETAAFTFMATLALLLYVRRSPVCAAALVLATLIRPEGGLLWVILLIRELVVTRKISSLFAVMAGVYVLYLLPFAAFKLFYYGSFLPNPFYAKTAFAAEQVINGLEYTHRFLGDYLLYGLALLPAVLAYPKVSNAARTVLLVVLVYVLYIVVIGGDVLKVHRFFMPLLPALAVTIVCGVEKILSKRVLVAAGVVVVMAWSLYMPRNHVRIFYRNEVGLVRSMGNIAQKLRFVDSRPFSIAVSTIGRAGYELMGHTVIDLLGLTDSTIARHPQQDIEGLESTWRERSFNSRYVLSRQPDYIMFATGLKPSAPAERALFLYSAFLNAYRRIGFIQLGKIFSVYKRYYPIEKPIVRDVNVKFVQSFNQSQNLWIQNDFDGVIAQLETCFVYSPEPKYPYILYHMAAAYRREDKMRESYRVLNAIIAHDTLVFEAYNDLVFFETRLHNYDRAKEYRSRVIELVPWMKPRMDKLLKEWGEEKEPEK